MPVVADGRQRALEGAREQLTELRKRIKATVREEWADRWGRSGVIGRFWLRLRMGHEVRQRMRREAEKVAPQGGLYAARGRS